MYNPKKIFIYHQKQLIMLYDFIVREKILCDIRKQIEIIALHVPLADTLYIPFVIPFSQNKSPERLPYK